MGKVKTAESRYLLIISCSQRKRPDPKLLPALERYDDDEEENDEEQGE